MPRQYLTPDTATAVTGAPTLLACRIARSPEGNAYRSFDPAVQRWQSLTWS